MSFNKIILCIHILDSAFRNTLRQKSKFIITKPNIKVVGETNFGLKSRN